MKFHLILMRHAKSDWSRPGMADHDRPLNMRGRSDTPAIARWLAEQEKIPDAILSSSAVRTTETATLLNASWKQPADVHFSESLYLASSQQIFQVISAEAPAWATQRPLESLMVLAHNPGISQAASTLTGGAVEMSTAAVMVFRCEVADWSERLFATNVQLVAQMRPKLLDRTTA